MKGALEYNSINPELFGWLLNSGEIWTRYRVLVDLSGCQEQDEAVAASRQEMIDHPLVQELAAECAGWGKFPGFEHSAALRFRLILWEANQ